MGKFSKFNTLLKHHIVLTELKKEKHEEIKKEWKKILKKDLKGTEKEEITRIMLEL